MGLSVTVVGSDPAFAFTAFVEGVGAVDVGTSLRVALAVDVGTSLRVALAGVDDVRLLSPVVVVFYAGSSGTFVDLAADLAWLTARPLTDFALDQHLPGPAEQACATNFFEMSITNQAIGALIDQGYPPEQAERHLTVHSVDAGISRYAVGLRILAGLDAR